MLFDGIDMKALTLYEPPIVRFYCDICFLSIKKIYFCGFTPQPQLPRQSFPNLTGRFDREKYQVILLKDIFVSFVFEIDKIFEFTVRI